MLHRDDTRPSLHRPDTAPHGDAEGAEGAPLELLEQSRLQSWTHMAPPAALDALVRERLHRAIEAEREALKNPELDPAPLHVPYAERWVYAFGVVAYGTQVAGGLMRLLWHTFAG